MAKPRYKPLTAKSKQILAEKRRAANILRQAGLLRRRSGRLTQSYLRTSSHFRAVRREFADVISGEARAAKINLTAANIFKAAGYRVKRAKSGKARVIVAKAVKRPTPMMPPPPAPRPRKPRPLPPPGTEHSFDDCLRRMIAWLRLQRGDLRWSASRESKLIEYATHAPGMFRKLINITYSDALLYRQGKGQQHQTEYRDGLTYEEDTIFQLFKDEFPELFYYHPTSSDTFVLGGIIPPC